MTDFDKYIALELKFELSQIDDNSLMRFDDLMKDISDAAIKGKSLKAVKQIIEKSNLTKYLKREIGSYINAQQSKILGKTVKFDLENIGFNGATFIEAIENRKIYLQRRALVYYQAVDNIIKDQTIKNKQTLISQARVEEQIRFERDGESFWRTQSKQARQYAYADQDKESDVGGWISIAILDNRTTPICIGLHNVFYSAEKYKTRFDLPYQIPRHNN